MFFLLIILSVSRNNDNIEAFILIGLLKIFCNMMECGLRVKCGSRRLIYAPLGDLIDAEVITCA